MSSNKSAHAGCLSLLQEEVKLLQKLGMFEGMLGSRLILLMCIFVKLGIALDPINNALPRKSQSLNIKDFRLLLKSSVFNGTITSSLIFFVEIGLLGVESICSKLDMGSSS